MRVIAALLCLFSCAEAAADSIGVFTVVEGNVQIVRAQQVLAAAAEVDVAADDIVETGDSASAQIELDDGTVFKLGSNTRLALSDYHLANKSVVSATVDVLAGWVRFAVSKLHADSRFQINTPSMTIGIRGTEGAIDAGAEEGGLQLDEGVVDVSSHSDEVTPPKPVRVNAGEFVQRHRGRGFEKSHVAPAAFLKRLPPQVRARVVRRAKMLKRRGVPPRVIRAMTREEVRHYQERKRLMMQRRRQQLRKQPPQQGTVR